MSLKCSVAVTDYFLLRTFELESSESILFVFKYFVPLAVHKWPFLYVLYVGVSCGQPDDPSNGRVDTSAGTSFGDVARYSCDTGYTRNGPAERTCQADGQWSGSAPTCESETLSACSDQIHFLQCACDIYRSVAYIHG